MTLKELKPVLCGKVVIYEQKPDAGPCDWYGDRLRNLYRGGSQEMPEELASRLIEIMIARQSVSGVVLDIQLRQQANGKQA